MAVFESLVGFDDRFCIVNGGNTARTKKSNPVFYNFRTCEAVLKENPL
ncbi:hypothetical protein [Ornithinibacillus gellani]|nr:hypothetical protein [Ornithinibacillus gellani]